MTKSSVNPFVFVSYPHVDKKLVENLVQSAQRTYEQLSSDAHCLLARMLFLRLIDVNTVEQEMVATLPRRVFMTELVLADVEQSNLMRGVVNAFADANVLMTGEMNGKWFVTVSNEILLQEWDLLHEWMQEEGLDTLRLLRRLSTAATDWRLHEQAKEGLYRGKMLEEALGLVQKVLLNETEEEFIKASMKEQGTQFNWEVAKMAAIGVGVVGTAVTMVRKIQTDTQLRKAKYWRNRKDREIRRLKKALQKQK